VTDFPSPQLPNFLDTPRAGWGALREIQDLNRALTNIPQVTTPRPQPPTVLELIGARYTPSVVTTGPWPGYGTTQTAQPVGPALAGTATSTWTSNPFAPTASLPLSPGGTKDPGGTYLGVVYQQDYRMAVMIQRAFLFGGYEAVFRVFEETNGFQGFASPQRRVDALLTLERGVSGADRAKVSQVRSEAQVYLHRFGS
jgi:hypothetical protein